MADPAHWTKSGFNRPTSPEWEEHSRVGDVSTGRAFKAAQLVPNTTRIDDVNGDQTLMYFGFSKPGTAASSAYWRIMKLTVSGTVTSFAFADGNDSFDNVWDDRASLTYS